jgi:hypothetical protein
LAAGAAAVIYAEFHQEKSSRKETRKNLIKLAG